MEEEIKNNESINEDNQTDANNVESEENNKEEEKVIQDDISGDNKNFEQSTEQEKNKEDDLKEFNPKETTIEQATNVLKTKGLDYAALQQEYNETKQISEETRAKLAEVGITSEFVDNFIVGQEARLEKALNEIAECVGGREAMNDIIKWASTNISDEEKLSIKNINNTYIMKSVLKDLKNRMEEKEGKVPESTLQGESGKSTVGDLFESQAQMFEAIKDPRYSKDEAYRNKVLKKIQASRVAGIDLGI